MKVQENQNMSLFPDLDFIEKSKTKGETTEELKRLDLHGEPQEKILTAL